MTITVLSGSRPETMAFARQKQLGYGIKHVVNRDSLRGARPTEVHVLPSFYKRRDIHAINSELKRIRRQLPNTPFIEWDLMGTGIYVQVSAEYEAPEPAVNPTPVAKNPEVVIDTSKDAVPGQMDLAEALPPVDANELARGKTPDDEIAAAHDSPIGDPDPDSHTDPIEVPNPRVEPSDDFLNFLDQS